MAGIQQVSFLEAALPWNTIRRRHYLTNLEHLQARQFWLPIALCKTLVFACVTNICIADILCLLVLRHCLINLERFQACQLHQLITCVSSLGSFKHYVTPNTAIWNPINYKGFLIYIFSPENISFGDGEFIAIKIIKKSPRRGFVYFSLEISVLAKEVFHYIIMNKKDLCGECHK